MRVLPSETTVSIRDCSKSLIRNSVFISCLLACFSRTTRLTPFKGNAHHLAHTTSHARGLLSLLPFGNRTSRVKALPPAPWRLRLPAAPAIWLGDVSPGCSPWGLPLCPLALNWKWIPRRGPTTPRRGPCRRRAAYNSAVVDWSGAGSRRVNSSSGLV